MKAEFKRLDEKGLEFVLIVFFPFSDLPIKRREQLH